MIFPDLRLTGFGNAVLKFPVDIPWAKVLLWGGQKGCGYETAAIAAVFSTQNPIYLRPRGDRVMADLARGQFSHPWSDVLSALNVFWTAEKAMTQVSPARKDKWFEDHYLSKSVFQEVGATFKRLLEIAKREKFPTPLVMEALEPDDPQRDNQLLHSIFLGFWHQLAVKVRGQEDVYRTIRGSYGLLDPSSVLCGQSHEWIVYSEFSFRGRAYFCNASRVEPEWLLVRYS